MKKFLSLIFLLMGSLSFFLPVRADATSESKGGAEFASAEDASGDSSHSDTVPADRIDTVPADRILAHANLIRDLKADPRIKKNKLNSKATKVTKATNPPKTFTETNFRYSQTEAHLKYILKSDYKEASGVEDQSAHVARFMENVKLFCERETKKLAIDEVHDPDALKFDDDVRAIIERIYREELEHQDRYVFYHGMSNEIGFLAEVLTELRSMLGLSGHGNIRTLRAFEKAFSHIKTADEFVAHFNELSKTSPDKYNYLPGYTDQGLSTNVFLFGNYPYAGSYTFGYFLNAYNESPPDISGILKELFIDLGIGATPEEVAPYLKEILDLRPSSRRGALLQILTRQKIVDQMAYIAEVIGPPLEVDIEGQTTHHPSSILSLIRKNPESANEFLKAHAHFRMQDGRAESRFFDDTLTILEARYFLKPDSMNNDSEVIVNTYWRNPLPAQEEEIYKTKLKSCIQRMGKKIVESGELLNPGHMGSAGSSTRQAPLVTLSRLVQSGGKTTQWDGTITDKNLNSVFKEPFSDNLSKKVSEFFKTRSIDAPIGKGRLTPLEHALNSESGLDWFKFVHRTLGATIDQRNQLPLFQIIVTQRNWDALEYIGIDALAALPDSAKLIPLLMTGLAQSKKWDLLKLCMQKGWEFPPSVPICTLLSDALEGDRSFLDAYIRMIDERGGDYSGLNIIINKENANLLRYIIEHSPHFKGEESLARLFLSQDSDDYSWYLSRYLGPNLTPFPRGDLLESSLLDKIDKNQLDFFKVGFAVYLKQGVDYRRITQRIIEKDALPFLEEALSQILQLDPTTALSDLLKIAVDNKASHCLLLLVGKPYEVRLKKEGWGSDKMDPETFLYDRLLQNKMFDLLAPVHAAGVALTPQAKEFLVMSGNPQAIDLCLSTEERVAEAAFMGALKANNELLIKRILDQGVQATDQSLMWLIENKNPLAESFIETYPETHTVSALMKCIKMNRIDLVRVLLSKGVDINGTAGGNFPLLTAVSFAHSNLDILKMLLERGALDQDDQALHASARRNFEIFKLCYDAAEKSDFDINRTNKKGQSLIFAAMDGDKKEVMDFVLSKNPKADIVDADGNNVFHYVSDPNYIDSILRLGGDINHQNKLGQTPLDWKYQRGYIGYNSRFPIDDEEERALKITTLWKEKGALTKSADSIATNWIYALLTDNVEEAEAALKSQPDIINKKLNKGMLPIEMAAIRGSGKIVQALLERGVSVPLDPSFYNPFVSAIVNKKNDVLTVLCRHFKDGFRAKSPYHNHLLKLLLTLCLNIKFQDGFIKPTAIFQNNTPESNSDAFKILLTELHDQKTFDNVSYFPSPSFLKIFAESASTGIVFPDSLFDKLKPNNSYGTAIKIFAGQGGTFNKTDGRGKTLLEHLSLKRFDTLGKILIDLGVRGVDIGFVQPTSIRDLGTLGKIEGLKYYALPLVRDETLRHALEQAWLPTNPGENYKLSYKIEGGKAFVLLGKMADDSWALPMVDYINTLPSSSPTHDFYCYGGIESGLYSNRIYFVLEEGRLASSDDNSLWVPVDNIIEAISSKNPYVLLEEKRYFLDRKIFITFQQDGIRKQLMALQSGQLLAVGDRQKTVVTRAESLPDNIIEGGQTEWDYSLSKTIIFVDESVAFKEAPSGNRRTLGKLSPVVSSLSTNIKEWQNRSASVFGLTPRNYHGRADILSQKLKEELNIDYSASLKEGVPTYFTLKDTRRMLAFANGILFQAHDHDGYGQTLKLFLQKWKGAQGFMPKEIYIIVGTQERALDLGNAFKSFEEIPITILFQAVSSRPW